jgi:MtN3 and saliva related transmembrane protein
MARTHDELRGEMHVQCMEPREALGWTSSLILVFTIARQVYKQWKTGTSEGVSIWLFVGQVTASIGFTVYSWFVRNWVFVVTNALMVLNALVGFGIVILHRRRDTRAAGGHASSARTRASPPLPARA